MTLYDVIKTAVPKLEAEYNMSKIVNHSASKGALREFLLKNIIRPFFPKRYGLCNGECFDSHDGVSKQLDVIVYDDLFSYAIPMGDYYMMPFESAYGEIEVKSMLNKEAFFESIDNIASFKSLIKETPGDCQVLPNLEIEIDGVKWNKAGFTKPFGVVFAYDSVKPQTVLNYFHEIEPLNPFLMPDMIVLLKEKTIIFRLFYESEKVYVTTSNTYQGFITLPCEDDTLPIFLSYILSRTRDTRLKIADTDDMLNAQIDKFLHAMGTQPVIKFKTQHNEEN
ncbi:DUF6602 domain-containing protein [Coprococcus catus]